MNWLIRKYTKRTALWLALACLGGLLVAGCGSGGDGDGEPTATASSGTGTARVLGAVTSTAVNELQQADGLVSRVFPAGLNQIFAVVTLEGVAPGMEVVGKWYQLSVPDADPNGTEVSSASILLTEENVVEGASRVALNVNSGAEALPEGDWLVRLYVDDVFLRTMAFVVTSQVALQPSGGEAGTPPGPSEPTAPTPEEAIPVASEYTVQDGDSLSSIADRFKAENETVEGFLTRMIQLNALETGASLFVGQVLRIPGPQ